MRAEQQRATVVGQQIGRIGILGRLDEFDLAVAVLRELLRFEARPHQRIAQQFDHQHAIAGQELPAHGNRFGARSGIEAAAHAFDGVGELEGAALAGAPVQQACDQRSHTRLRGRIGERTTTHEATEGDQRHFLFRHENDGQTIRQHETLMRRHLHARGIRVCCEGTITQQRAEEQRGYQCNHGSRQACAAHCLGSVAAGALGAAGACGGDSRIPTVRRRFWNTSAAAFCTSARVTFSYAPGAVNSFW